MIRPEPSRHGGVVLLAALLLTSMLSACGPESARPAEKGPASSSSASDGKLTEPNAAIKKQATQFEWQQKQKRYGDEEQSVIETAQFNSFIQTLRSRDARYVPTVLKPLVDNESWESIDEPGGLGSERGRNVVRLMDVKIDGDRAYTISCVDQHEQQSQPAGASGEWGPVDDPYKTENFQFKRSEDSPTGWVREGGFYVGQKTLPPAECSRDVFDRKPAVVEKGPVESPGA